MGGSSVRKPAWAGPGYVRSSGPWCEVYFMANDIHIVFERKVMDIICYLENSLHRLGGVLRRAVGVR